MAWPEPHQRLRVTIDEFISREVLDWLLVPNHQCYAEEVAMGLHEARTAKARSGAKGAKAAGGDGGQLGLF